MVGNESTKLLLRKVYTKEELQDKISQRMKEYERSSTENDYRSMAQECYDIGRLLELLEDERQSGYYFQKAVDEWNAHPQGVPDYICINALEDLNKLGDALELVLRHPTNWSIRTLARFYEKLGRNEEARLLYAGLAYHSYRLSEAYYPFWQPHYLREGADLYEKAQNLYVARIYSDKAVESWEKVRNNTGRYLYPVEEGWLYEEAGYIYEEVDKFEKAMDHYEEAKSKYELAYTEEYLASTETHQIDGDWDTYLGFFAQQIPVYRLLYFRFDSGEVNECRRITYRILSLEEKMKR